MRSVLKQSFFDKYGDVENEKWFSTKEARIHFREMCLEEARDNYRSFVHRANKARRKFGSHSPWYEETEGKLLKYVLEAEETLKKVRWEDG